MLALFVGVLIEVFLDSALSEGGEEDAEAIEDRHGGEGAEDDGDEGVFDDQSDNERASEGEEGHGGGTEMCGT